MEKSLAKALIVGLAALAAAFLVFGALALFDNGYRMNGLRVAAPGTMLLTHVPEGAHIRLGGQEIPETPRDGELLVSLAGGKTHHLIISREGFWPWGKELAIPSGASFVFSVFLMPVSPVGAPVLKNPERRELEAAFAKTKVPTRDLPARSADGFASLFVEDGKIVTQWEGEGASPQYYCVNDAACKEHVALSFDAELRDLAFYPGRNDLALLAIQNGIFTLELDNRGTQNFQPVYRGTRPRMLLKDGVVYLKEGLGVLRLSL